VADFNSDGSPDYVLQNTSTRQTAIWYLNNNVFVSAAYGPSLPAGWNVIDVADFNLDGNLDYTLFNAGTRQTAIWYLSGVAILAERKDRTKLALSKYAAEAAEQAALHRDKLGIAGKVRDVESVHKTLWPEEKKTSGVFNAVEIALLTGEWEPQPIPPGRDGHSPKVWAALRSTTLSQVIPKKAGQYHKAVTTAFERFVNARQTPANAFKKGCRTA